jgi:rhomboid family GlyGly-CTERM serine protease
VNQYPPRMGIFRSLNCDGAYAVALALAVAVLLLPALGGESLRAAWQYDRVAIQNGQLWRFVSAHFVHLDMTHALLNAVGLVLLWGLFARIYAPLQWLAAMSLTLVALALGFWFLQPQLQWYVGASGLLHGVFAFGAMALLRQRDRIGQIAAVVFAMKLAFEQWRGPLPFEEHGIVIVAAHLYGALGGLVAGLLIRAADKRYT